MYYFSATYFLSIGAIGFLLINFRHHSSRLSAFTPKQWKPIVIGASTSMILGGLLCICQLILNNK